MVSGDHIETAKRTAIKAGIISEHEVNERYVCMTGEEFRNAVGQLRKELDNEGNAKMHIQNIQEFRNIQSRLRVLARAIPYDKHLLVVGLRQLGKTVAVTGDGINDIEALKCSDVGFAMGSGCSAAKEAADMILIDDNFESTMKAVMWGRNIFSNVKKFIQFQVSVNISTLIIVFLGTIILGESPFGTVNLLWINLIMDTFAALALATEVPHPSIIKSPPVKKGDNILTPVVWRQIYGVSLYIIVVMAILMVFGKVMWDFDYKQTDPLFPDKAILKVGEEGNYDKMKHYTVLFNTYVFMLIFNEINCRKVGSRQFNVFSNLFSNLFFPLVVGAVAAVQLLMVTIFARTARMYYLTSQQIAASIIWGSTVLVVSAVLKLTPDNWIKKLPITIDENKQIDESDPLMRLYKTQANAKVATAKKEVPTIQPE